MVPLHRNTLGVILILLFTNLPVNAKKTKHKCPIGFSLAYTKYKGDDPICYRRKGPEGFDDKYKDCAGNLYSSKLYHTLNITETNLVLWTDYRSLYPGGPFIDWSYTETTGDLLITSYEVTRRYDPNLVYDEELCVVIDPITNFTATKCTEKYYRYCFLRPYVREDDMSREGCEDLSDYWRFWSPRASCLTAVTGAGGGTVRANWRQAKELCAKRGGSLLNKGWRYANNPLLSDAPNPTFPLGIVLSPDNSSIRYDLSSEDSLIPSSEWQFESKMRSNETSLGALRDSFWYMVNSTYVFFNVICERTIDLKPVNLTVTVKPDNKIVLTTSEKIYEKNIYCFTDSVIHYPTRIKFKYDDDTGYYVLSPVADGHYWCMHLDSWNHVVSQSNTALFIRVKQELENFYAVKFKVNSEYTMEKLEPSYREWEKKLEEYIFLRNRYEAVYGEIETTELSVVEGLLKSFKASTMLETRDRKVIRRMKIKRLFLDSKTVLVHVELSSDMKMVSPGRWNGLEVEYMKPIYFCKGFDSIPTRQLGSSAISVGCRNHTCVGDFDEGVQWVTTAAAGCSAPPPAPVTSSVRFQDVNMEDAMPTAIPVRTSSPTSDPSPIEPTTDSDSSEEVTSPTFELKPRPIPTEPPSVPTTVPYWTTEPDILTTEAEVVSTTYPIFPVTTTTAAPVLPDEQLQQVLEDLENLLQNDTIPVFVEDLDNTFDQVDNLLQMDEDLEIPGELLHLLDEIGARIKLNGTNRASAVRNNIALVLADAKPEAPVRGLRIAARESAPFTDEAFEIISETLNSTHMTTNTTEAVVHLPDSVASSSRRISFVVFRNDRAFQSNHGTYALNSKVLSINVENLTHFDQGEFIDIHLTPVNEDLDRNQSRACAYWHFFEDGTGYWSQDGCTLIKSTEEGVLDTCRCTHLTHFAEVLVPRTVFSEKNENVLEILTIIGCCLSIFGLALVGLTAALFRSWRRDYSNKIWLQLCIAIFLLVTCFLIIVFAKFETYDVPCMLVGVALHYSVLASFCWMLVAAVLSYRRLVIVFTRDASHKLLRASAFSWGAPCAVVGILLSVAPHSYAGRFEEKTPSGAFCYPSGLGLWLAVYAPIAIMLVANWTLFALIVRSVFASRRIQRHGDSNEAIRCASVSCLLVFLFGLPWLFGLFAYNIVAAYLFTLTATFQGFVLFLFFVLGNKKTRDLWLNKLKIKQTRKVPVTSSTYTNRSTGPGSRGGGGASTIEANSSKPRSLNSPDNSRFS